MVVVKFWSLIASSLWLCSTFVFAETPSAEQASASAALEARLVAFDGVIAQFDQTVTNAQGYLVEQASGTLHLAKPRFRWEVSDPFPQIILANSSEVEIYDPDLEQVTRRTLGNALHEAPLALLTEADLALEQHFSVDVLGAYAANDEGLDGAPDLLHTRYVLRPLSSEALFERIEIEFINETLSALVIYDHTGQETLIRFAEYRAQQVIQSSMFELEYPAGTDFVRG